VVNRLTGEIREAHLFVAVMGASSLSFAWPTWTETLPDWTDSHVRAFGFFGGAARLLVPDNAKVAVIKACLYDPQVNRTYAELAAHYGTAVLAARPYRPRDKAKVEACVGIVERWLFGRLRNRIWYGMDELRAAVAEMMTALNDRIMRRLGRSRRALFEEIDQPLLKTLPTEPYVLAEWRRCKVGIDYHVEASKHFYSVPYRHARAQVEVRLTARTVEIFLKGERIASHVRGSGNGHHTTINDHMPSSHRRYGDWTVERLLDEAGRLGPTAPSSTSASPACSTNSPSRAATAASPAGSKASPVSNCSFWMTGAFSPWMLKPGMTCWRSWRIDTAGSRPSSPVSSPRPHGIMP
jgi:transposase